MATYMDSKLLEKFLTHILSPVYRIIEEDTIVDCQLGTIFLPFPIHRLIDGHWQTS
jgi:hypothetical protein